MSTCCVGIDLGLDHHQGGHPGRPRATSSAAASPTAAPTTTSPARWRADEAVDGRALQMAAARWRRASPDACRGGAGDELTASSGSSTFRHAGICAAAHSPWTAGCEWRAGRPTTPALASRAQRDLRARCVERRACSRRAGADQRSAISSATSPRALHALRRGAAEDPKLLPSRSSWAIFDKAILIVENEDARPSSRSTSPAPRPGASPQDACRRTSNAPGWTLYCAARSTVEFDERGIVGTGYGRADGCRSPRIRSAARSSATVWARTPVPGTRVRCSTSAARTPRPSRWTTGHRDQLPDERPLRRRLRPLPRLHRRRDEPGRARARPAGP